MTNPEAQHPTPETPAKEEVNRTEWAPPQLEKLPITETAFSGTGSIPDGITFSS
jgi:hypothetical protein